jgi:integrase
VSLIQSRPRKSGQDDKWSFCLTAGKIVPRIRRDADQTRTVHGFRSTFRDWASEQTEFPNDAIEMALAHTVGSKVEQAYRRSDMLEKRRALMTEWGAFYDGSTHDG